jgi:hypothetical protein
MRAILCASLVFAAIGWSDERTDRRAIQSVVEALNAGQAGEGQKHVANLFTGDADNQLDRLSDLDRRMLPSSHKPWSEVTIPRVVVQSIRLITKDVALVDAANTQYGSTVLVRRVPLLMVMRREAKGWRIASLRVMVDLLSLP